MPVVICISLQMGSNFRFRWTIFIFKIGISYDIVTFFSEQLRISHEEALDPAFSSTILDP